MKTYRWFPLMIAMAIITSAALACGGDDPQSPDPTSTPPAGEPTSPADGITPTAVPTSAVPFDDLPAPQTAAGESTIAIQSLDQLGVLGPPSRGGATYSTWGVAESLFQPDGTYDDPNTSLVTGLIATDWTMADDYSKVTIELKQGVEFHGDWGEMTADDYVWSFNDFRSEDSLALQAGRIRAVFEEAVQLDEYTFELPFNNFDPSWNIGFLNSYGIEVDVLSKRAFDEMGEEWYKNNLIGTGPYSVSEYRPSELIRLQAVPNHHDTTAAIDVLHVREVPEESTRVAMMRNGQADSAEISHRNLGDLVDEGFSTSSSGKANQLAIVFAGNYWIENHANCLQGIATAEYCPDIEPGESVEVPVESPGYDTSLPWVGEFGNDESMEQARMVRMALAMAVDREAIIETVLGGVAWENHLKFFSILSPHWNSDWEIQFDPDEAERLLDEAGYPRGSGGVRFRADFQPGHQAGGPGGINGEVSQAIAGMWSNLGVQTTVLMTEPAGVNPTRRDRSLNVPWLNACGGPTARDGAPYDWPRVTPYTTLARPGLGCGMEIPKIEETLLETLSELDEERRIELNLELAEYLHHWRLVPGTVAVPEPVVWNPRAYESWDMITSGDYVIGSPQTIVPRQR